jgi:hypothetical protein
MTSRPQFLLQIGSGANMGQNYEGVDWNIKEDFQQYWAW